MRSTAPDIVWLSESNVMVTGGFGPNQVASVLGLGWLAIGLLAAIALTTVRRATSNLARGGLVSLTLWALLFMAHGAMRIVAASVLFGLGYAVLDASRGEREDAKRISSKHRFQAKTLSLTGHA